MGFEFKIKQYFNQFEQLGPEEERLVDECFVQRSLKKKYILLHQGDVCNFNSFVVSGLLKMYYYDFEGKEHILQFSQENWWIGDPNSFHHNIPSDLYIETMEDSVLLQINKKDFYGKLMKNNTFNTIFRKLTENAMISLQKRVISNLKDSANDRYDTFLKVYPNVSNRIPDHQIASYIGVTPQFLSKMRSQHVKSS